MLVAGLHVLDVEDDLAPGHVVALHLRLAADHACSMESLTGSKPVGTEMSTTIMPAFNRLRRVEGDLRGDVDQVVHRHLRGVVVHV